MFTTCEFVRLQEIYFVILFKNTRGKMTMNIVIKKIKNDYFGMTDTYKLIADTVIKHQNNFNLTVKELSTESYCAQSTIIKFCNSLGYESYKVFKHEINSSDQSNYSTIIDSFELVDNYISNNNDLIQALVTAIQQSNQVYIFATGQSRISAIDFYLKVNKILDDRVIFEYEPAIQSRIIKTLRENDLVIFVSNSGQSKELISFLPKIKKQCENIFLISNRENSTLSNKINNSITLNNNIESQQNFKEFPKESKYSLIYFFDYIFDLLRNP